MMKTNNSLRMLAMLFVATGFLIFAGCGDDDPKEPDPTMTILELVELRADGTDEFGGLDSLKKYLDLFPTVKAPLGAAGDITFFAPTNAAFISLLAIPGFPQDIRIINPDIVGAILSYHISNTRLEAAGINPADSIESLIGEYISFTEDGFVVGHGTTAKLTISELDIKATNGVMHVMGNVLISPSLGAKLAPIIGTNAATLLLGADFSDLATAIGLADEYAVENELDQITAILAGGDADSKRTVFAPTNGTFEAAAAAANEGAGVTVAVFISSLTGQQWYGTLANHIVMDDITADELVHGAVFPTRFTLDGVNFGDLVLFSNTDLVPAANGIGVFIDSNDDVDITLADGGASLVNLDAEIALPNAAENSNGRVHVIAGILVPPTP